MKIYTFKDDLIGLESFAKRLEDFIATENDYVEGSLVLALTSKYGSGKTTFLEMWKSSIESADDTENKPLVISLNAWESDYYGDPLFAIISALVERIETNGQSAAPLIDAAKDLGWFATAISGQVVKKMTGIDAVEAGDLAEKKRVQRKESVPVSSDTFSMYLGRKTAMESLKNALREFVAASEPKVLFLVDELDRCRPDYAISYLETIKHIFDIKGAVFILAADRQQLENSARMAFGQDLDFEEYYRKFIHREIALPPIPESSYMAIASKYVDYYLEREGSRHCFMKLERARIEDITRLVGALKLTPRQIQEVFRILGHILTTSEANRGRLLWCLAVGSIAMAVLKVGEPKTYRLLGSGQLDPKEAVNFLKPLVGDSHVEWWFLLFFTGGGLRTNDGESAQEVMKRAGFTSEGQNQDLHSGLGQYYQGWGGRSSRIPDIYEKIEHISQWK
jgi:hypothetical protein